MLMRLLDEKYTEEPYFGVLRMTAWLREDKGQAVNPKRVRRLMRLMRLEAIYPKPNLSRKHPEHRIYPYLLRGLPITRRNQVWSTDITYIRVNGGFLYLVAVMDWFSRYVLSWELSNTLDNTFCINALERALDNHGQPDIFNSDQGCQFTSNDFTGVLLDKRIRISMDGKGRALDNIYVERLWRSVKYEEVYLSDYQCGRETYEGLNRYLHFYNEGRRHQSLGYRTPQEVYIQRKEPRGRHGTNLASTALIPANPAWN
jgi:putative transposase